jgi:hypothetical protein
MKGLRYLLASLLLLVVFPVAGNKIFHKDDKYAFRGDLVRCAIKLDGYQTGFNYELLKAFCKSHCDSSSIIPGEDITGLLGELARDSLDILLMPASEFNDTLGLVNLVLGDTSVAWVMRNGKSANRELFRWYAGYRGTREYSDLVRRFSECYGAGNWRPSSGVISPYDNLFKSNAKLLGWDWRLLAALAWSESKFKIQAKSPKGALGIMQMMPVTAGKFGVTSCLDPEENISAATNYLAFLQKTLSRYAEDPEILSWLTIAAYNSGGGRALQDLEGRERSSATEAYTEAVLRQYDIFSGRKKEEGLLRPDSLGGIDPGDEDAGDQKEEHDDQEGEDISHQDHGNVDMDGDE